MSSEFTTTGEGGEGAGNITDKFRHDYHEQSSEEPSAGSSRTASPKGAMRKERKGVRFNSSSEMTDDTNKRMSLPLREMQSQNIPAPPASPIYHTHFRNNSATKLLVRHDGGRTPEHEEGNPFADSAEVLVKGLSSAVIKKPRPSVLRNNSANSVLKIEDITEENFSEKAFSALAAQERAQRVATLVGSHSAPASRRGSTESVDADGGAVKTPYGNLPVSVHDIPLVDIRTRHYNGTLIDLESDDEESGLSEKRQTQTTSSEAHTLVRSYTQRDGGKGLRMPAVKAGLVSGQITPSEEHGQDYVARPEHFRLGILSSLMKLQGQETQGFGHRRNSSGTGASQSPSASSTPGLSGTTTPSKQKQAKWYNHKTHSTQTLNNLIEASNMLSSPAGGKAGSKAKTPSRPGMGARASSSRLFDMSRLSRPRLEDEIRITVHIAETLSRQKYLVSLCRALMQYGAPTHRLEEYMRMSARVLEINGQFLYIPGCMLISFDDVQTHTTEVRLVRATQGLDLGRLKDVHDIYKEVVHDVIGVEEASQRLENVVKAPSRIGKWWCVLLYGIASASVGPFAFGARFKDLPICFILGCIVGIMQLVLAPKSDLYSNVFEVSAAVVTSFLARAFGSIPNPYPTTPGDAEETYYFCFAAAAQSSIALILPGYMVLCGALELQSRSMVAGSVRMVYAIIYSLFLGFGITVGTAVFGLMYGDATSETQCLNTPNEYWKFAFVPIFTLTLCVINQAKWRQIPTMLIIAMSGYTVNFFSAKKFPSNAQISNTLGALVVGAMGNLHSRLRHGVAAASMLPALFVQVPSGLAASGSLLAGLSSADKITNQTSWYNSGGNSSTLGMLNGTSTITISSSSDLNSVVFNVGFSMVQIAIGITVGLFLSALIIYPLGKRRSGLFSF